MFDRYGRVLYPDSRYNEVGIDVIMMQSFILKYNDILISKRLAFEFVPVA